MITIPSIQELRTQLLTNWRNQDPEVQTHPYSDEWIRSNAVAGSLWSLYARLEWVAKQLFPGTAGTEWLEKWADLFGLARVPAATATGGQIQVTGTVGAEVASGSLLVHADGTIVQVTQAGTVGDDGTVELPVGSVTAGTVGNKQVGDSLTFQAPGVGVDGTAEITVALTGGKAAETDLELRTRLKARLQEPPAGGKAADYASWAKTVTGILGAWVYSGRRGPGSVDVVPWSDADDRMPSDEQLAEVEAAIEANRPVSAWDYLVLRPELIPVDVTATVTLEEGAVEETVITAVEAAIVAYFSTLIPGQRAVRSKIEAAISAVSGVTDRSVSAPTTNQTAIVSNAVIELLTVGNLSVEVD